MIRCKIFGHRAPSYGYGTGKPYFEMNHALTDSIGRVHVCLYARCSRCGARFHVANTHVDSSAAATKVEADADLAIERWASLGNGGANDDARA